MTFKIFSPRNMIIIILFLCCPTQVFYSVICADSVYMVYIEFIFRLLKKSIGGNAMNGIPNRFTIFTQANI